MYVWYVVIPYISMIYLSGALPQVWARDQLAWVRGQERISCCTWRINELNCKIMRSTATRPGCEAWVRGQEHISCCTWHINELNCKTMDRQERLRRRREYERARRSAETAEQKELRLSRRREADRARRAAT